jgi:hypothetical protein
VLNLGSDILMMYAEKPLKNMLLMPQIKVKAGST